MRDEFNAARAKWDEEHRYCPKCSCDEFQETCIGWRPPGKNPNTSTCQNPECRWKGPSEDRVSWE